VSTETLIAFGAKAVAFGLQAQHIAARLNSVTLGADARELMNLAKKIKDAADARVNSGL